MELVCAAILYGSLCYIWTVLQEIQCKVATKAMCISDLVVT